MNMKNFIKISTKWMMLLCISAILWVACKEDEPQLDLARQFQPAAFTITGGETTAKIAWNPSLFTLPGEVEYVLEVSKDGVNFTNVEYTATTTDAEVTIADTDIDIQTNYFARVKALGSNGTGDSNWLMSSSFQITGEIFILPINEYDILTDGALIHWQLKGVLTKITITPTGGTAFDVAISDAEYNAGQKLVTGLTQNTTYRAEVFNAAGVPKGFVTFTTKNAFTGSNIVDLRGITGKPKILRDTLQDIPSGSVVYLKRGQIYTVDATDVAATRVFTKSVTLMSGPDLNPNLARIHLTTNYNFVAAAVVDSVVFRDLIIKGVRASGASFDNDYVINSNVSATVGKIRFDNCKISRLRGTVRAQAAAPGTQIANYFINKCSLDSIREFAVVMSSAGSAFANVKITNSTFYKCRRYIDHRVTGNSTVVIENCTFNEVPSGGVNGTNPPTNYLIDFNTFNSNITIKNSIIGKTWIETAGNTDAGGIRVGASSTINVTNTYTLSDFVSTVVAFQIPGATAYPGSSTSVYTNPSVGDFKIKDLAFPGATSAGDPKWRP